MSARRLTCADVSFAYEGYPSLWRPFSLALGVGFSGVVGGNGEGKTTLLSLLGGERVPSSGHIQLAPRDALVVRLTQRADALGAEGLAFLASQSGHARVLRARLRVEEAWSERFDTLSPGEKQRVQLGGALLREPDVLLLDEPTNHLDAETTGVLIHALRAFRGIGVMVSHDRVLLDALTTSTVRMHGGEVRTWPGSYSVAREHWLREAEARAAMRDEAARRVSLKRAAVGHARDVRARADRARSMRHVMKSSRDHDARNAGQKTRAGWAEKRAGRAVAVAHEKLARAEASLALTPVAKVDTLGGKVHVPHLASRRTKLAVVTARVLAAGSHRVLHDVHVVLEAQTRVRVLGENGAGKSTLLRALACELDAHAVAHLHLPQELSPGRGLEALDSLHELASKARGEVLALVAALGTPPERLLSQCALSEGEARKLVLALGLVRGVTALLLDEPQNHLDLPSRERLEAALAEYGGAVVVVTHDEGFARCACPDVWLVASGRVVTRRRTAPP